MLTSVGLLHMPTFPVSVNCPKKGDIPCLHVANGQKYVTQFVVLSSIFK